MVAGAGGELRMQMQRDAAQPQPGSSHHGRIKINVPLSPAPPRAWCCPQTCGVMFDSTRHTPTPLQLSEGLYTKIV